MKYRIGLFVLIFFMAFNLNVYAKSQGKEFIPMKQIQDKVHSFKLDNGMRFVVMERGDSPVVSFVTFVKVGSVDEVTGHTGIAHILEHMAFKGTKDIGTKDYKKEKGLLKQVDQAYREFLYCKYSGTDKSRCQSLENRFHKLLTEANSLVIPNEFSKIIEKNGGEDLNAATSTDYTIYHVSLPANKVELWFSLEYDRLTNPVFREFYTEKEVIREERRMRVDTSPMGKLLERFRSICFLAHPYSHPTIGWDSDIRATTISDVKRFYKTYYVPQNITIAIVGDVDFKEIKRLALTYFGHMKKGKNPPIVWTIEPPQDSKRDITVFANAQPMYIRGYHVPGYGSKDFLVLEVLETILSGGRSSRLYKDLVLEKRVALSIAAFNGYPGVRYPCIFGIYAIPNKGVSLNTLSQAIDMEFEKIEKKGVQEEEIERACTLEKGELLRELESNLGMARELAYAHAIYGDWKRIFLDIDEMEKISPKDIQLVIKKYFINSNMIEARLLNKHEKENNTGN